MRQAGFKQGMEALPCPAGRPLTSIPAGHPGTGRAELGSSLALPPSNPHSLLCRPSEALRRPPSLSRAGALGTAPPGMPLMGTV